MEDPLGKSTRSQIAGRIICAVFDADWNSDNREIARLQRRCSGVAINSKYASGFRYTIALSFVRETFETSKDVSLTYLQYIDSSYTLGCSEVDIPPNYTINLTESDNVANLPLQSLWEFIACPRSDRFPYGGFGRFIGRHVVLKHWTWTKLYKQRYGSEPRDIGMPPEVDREWDINSPIPNKKVWLDECASKIYEQRWANLGSSREEFLTWLWNKLCSSSSPEALVKDQQEAKRSGKLSELGAELEELLKKLTMAEKLTKKYEGELKCYEGILEHLEATDGLEKFRSQMKSNIVDCQEKIQGVRNEHDLCGLLTRQIEICREIASCGVRSSS